MRSASAPIKLVEFETDDEAFAAFAAGKSDVYIADFPVVVYLAKNHTASSIRDCRAANSTSYHTASPCRKRTPHCKGAS